MDGKKTLILKVRHPAVNIFRVQFLWGGHSNEFKCSWYHIDEPHTVLRIPFVLTATTCTINAVL